MRTNTVESFWTRVAVGAPDECWPWKLGLTEQGYGKVSWVGKTEVAHRLAYQLHHGIELPRERRMTEASIHVLHKCDNPPCCNPEHLWLGTQLENRRDCATKNRTAKGDKHSSRTHPERVARGDNTAPRKHPERIPRGSQNHFAKLTEQDVFTIRARAVAGETLAQIGRDFGVTTGAVWHIHKRRNWKHI